MSKDNNEDNNKENGFDLTKYFNEWKDDPQGMALSKEGAWIGGAFVASLLILGPGLFVTPLAIALATGPGRNLCKKGASGVFNALPGDIQQKLLPPPNKDKGPE